MATETPPRVRVADVVDPRTTLVDSGDVRRVYLARGEPPADGTRVSLDADGFVVPWGEGMPMVGVALPWNRDAVIAFDPREQERALFATMLGVADRDDIAAPR